MPDEKQKRTAAVRKAGDGISFLYISDVHDCNGDTNQSGFRTDDVR